MPKNWTIFLKFMYMMSKKAIHTSTVQ